MLTWWSTGSYNIIAIHICCTGMKIVDQLKDARILNEQKQKAADERKAAGFVIHKLNGSNSSLISFFNLVEYEFL